MQIGSFLDNRISQQVTYSYYHRGMKTFYLPDDLTELEACECYTKHNGNLFHDIEVSWKNTVLIQDGIDIRIDLHEKCFVDHVELIQGASSGLAGIEVLCMQEEAYKKIGSHMPETGKLITDSQISVPVGYYSDHVIVRLQGDCSPVHIKKLDVWGAWELEHAIYPTPAWAEYKKETISLYDLKTIKANGADASFAAAYLCNKLKDKTGFAPEMADDFADISFEITKREDEKDAFLLEIADGKCRIEASGRRGLLYAVDSMLQLICGDTITCCRIQDHAFMDYRGVHLALPPKAKVGFIKEMVKNVFVPMRYNMVILEIGGALRFDNYPEINEAWQKDHYSSASKDIWEKDELRELCSFFTSYGIEVVPQVQSFGHTRYITMAYPWLAEKKEVVEEETIDLNTADIKPDATYYNTMCPLHPQYYEVTLGIADEIIEAVEPERFVHMGHDEIYDIGTCPKCSKVPRGELFGKEVTTLYHHIKVKGLKMIIWSDMLHALPYGAPTAISMLPRDIIMMDFIWYFYMDEEPEDTLLKYGYPVIMGNMYSSHYPRFEKRARKKGVLGAQVSIWGECGEVTYAHKGKMYEFVYSGECMWSEDYRSDMRLTYNELIKPMLKEIRYHIGNLKCSGSERSVMSGGEEKNIPYDIRDCVSYSGTHKVDLSDPEICIPVEAYAEIISVVHATDIAGPRLMWKPLSKIGEYIMEFEDGSTHIEDIFYAGNIYKYRSTYGDRMKSKIFRHEGYAGTYLAIPECGKTCNGEDYTLGNYSFRNPYPTKKIKTVTLKHLQNSDVKILLFNVTVK